MEEQRFSGEGRGALALLDASPVPTWIHDRETLQFLEVNQAALKEFGFTIDEFRSRTITDLRPSLDKPRLAEMLRREAAGTRERGSWALLHADGTTAVYDLVGADVEFEGRTAILVVVYPVTPRVAHMARLAASDERVASQLQETATQVTRELGHARAVLGSMTDGVIAFDAAGRVSLLNSAGSAMLGWTEAEVLGLPIREVVAAFADLAPTLVHEDIIRTKDGLPLPVALSIAPLDELAGGGTVITFRNLSREREERLRHRTTERLYRQVIEGANDLIYVQTKSGRILEVNPAVERILGYTPDEARGMTSTELLAPESVPVSRANLHAKLNGEAEITRYSVVMIGKQGQRVWLEVSSQLLDRGDGRPVIHGVARDITARVEAEAIARREQANLRAMMETINAAAWVFDGKGHILYTNEEMVRMLGFPRERIMEEGFFRSRMRRSVAPAARQVFDEWESGTDPHGTFEAAVLNAANEWRTLQISIGRIEYDGRKMFLGSAFDVTDARRSEEQYRQLAHRLVEAQERERAQLARELHDEFGQDLTALTLMLGNDQMDDVAHEEVMAIIKKLIAATRSMALDLRPSALDHLGLQTACTSLVDRFGRRSGLDIQFSSDLPAGARFERDIELAAYRILQEALTNVARHSGSGSAECQLSLESENLVLTVRDAGQGFDTKSSAALEGKAGVMGIRERAAAVSGEMQLSSAPGRGTVVTVRLPARSQKGSES